jgi:hypothetical protein
VSLDNDASATPRREFLGQMVLAAAVLASTACAPAIAASSAPPTPSPVPTPPATPLPKQSWDDGWTQRLTAAKHKAVFDSPEMGEGVALWQAALVLNGYHDALDAAEGDVVPVIVMRHAGVPLAFGDALWEKYEIARELKLKDPHTGRPYTRNPYLSASPDASGLEATATLAGLRAKGAVLLACNLAAMGYAARIAARTKQEVAAVRAEVRAGLAPGVILQPSGVYATIRAQEMGAAFMRSA